MLFELDGDVFDGRQRAEDMNSLVRSVDVNLQFSMMSANLNVLIAINNFDESRIRILFQLLHDGTENRQRLPRLLGSAAHVLGRNEVHGHGNGPPPAPYINLATPPPDSVHPNSLPSFPLPIFPPP